MLEIESINDIDLITNDYQIQILVGIIEIRAYLGNLKGLSVFVYNKEGDYVPHFHVKKIGSNDICMKILDAAYFKHGKNDGTLTKKELKLLQEWLSNNNNQHWKEIISEWNKREQGKVSDDTPVPNYLEKVNND